MDWSQDATRIPFPLEQRSTTRQALFHPDGFLFCGRSEDLPMYIEYDKVRRERDDLRQILEPLLTGPIPAPITRCVFCEKQIVVSDPWDDAYAPEHHAADCPVLSRDRLLGRPPLTWKEIDPLRVQPFYVGDELAAVRVREDE